MHEAIMTYDELRSKVLQMTLFNKTESNVKTHKPEPMDISQVMNDVIKKFKERMQPTEKQELKPEENTTWKLGSTDSMDSVDKYMQDIMAIMKGKEKGKSDIICYNCGKTGHMAKDCWAPPKGESKGGKYGGKGDYGKTNYFGNYGKGKGNYFGKSNDKGKFGGKGYPESDQREDAGCAAEIIIQVNARK